MFRASLCPSSGADDFVVFFAACGVVPWLCRQSDPVGWLCVHWGVRSTYVLRTPQWAHNQPTGSDCLHSHDTTPHALLPVYSYCANLQSSWGPGSSVGIATDYGLDGPRSNPGGDEIFRPSTPVVGPTQPPVQWVPGLPQG